MEESEGFIPMGNSSEGVVVQQGENLNWIEAAGAIPDSNDLVQQFKTFFERISADRRLDEDTRSISLQKTEAVVKGLARAEASPKYLHHALLDAKSWFSDNTSDIWNQLNNILRGEVAHKTIGTITESNVKGAIKGLLAEH